MQELSFFDCSCSYGMRSIVNPGSFYKMEDLLKKMEHYGIKKALVYRSMAREYNPAMGNEMLMNEIKDIPALVPVWVVMPHHTGEFPEPAVLKDQLKKNGIKAVRMFPGATDHNYSFSEWNCGELFSMLEATGIPLLIGLDQVTWDGLHDVLSRHPGMKLILTDVNYRVDRSLFALVKKFDNLYVETFGYKQHHGIEEFCKRFGAHRMVFGSGMPAYSGGAAVAMINYARISDEEKRMIAYENLEKILGGVRYE